MQFGDSELVQNYPAHTRVVSRAWQNTCTMAYAISLPGARRLLYELSVNKMTGPTDMMFRSVCHGSEGRPIQTCLTVQPQLFQHHRPVGDKSSFSDISDHGADYNEQAFTRNVRWSTRVNFRKLVDGMTDYIDLFKDGEEADPNLGFKWADPIHRDAELHFKSDDSTQWNAADRFRKYESGLFCHTPSDLNEPRLYTPEFRIGKASRRAQQGSRRESRGSIQGGVYLHEFILYSTWA